MAYVLRTVLRSGVVARGAKSYESCDEAVHAAGDQLKTGLAIEIWVEGSDGAKAADMHAIMRQCRITEWRLRRIRSKLRM